MYPDECNSSCKDSVRGNKKWDWSSLAWGINYMVPLPPISGQLELISLKSTASFILLLPCVSVVFNSAGIIMKAIQSEDFFSFFGEGKAA